MYPQGIANVKRRLGFENDALVTSALAIIDSQCTAVSSSEYIMPISKRLEFYLGKWQGCDALPAYNRCSGELDQYSMSKAFRSNSWPPPMDEILCVQYDAWKAGVSKLSFNKVLALAGAGDSSYMYGEELQQNMELGGWTGDNSKEPLLAVMLGDTHESINLPILRKTRSPSSNSSTILFKMEAWRHFVSLVDVINEDNLDWDKKLDIAVWRGATTGWPQMYPTKYWANPDQDPDADKYHTRAHLIRQIPKWDRNPHLDIGVNMYLQGVPNLWGTKSSMSRSAQMNYKMLIVAEGNDVATMTKWALMSTSAVIMPIPQVSSWLMEELLVPWKHFIPVRQDFADLEAQVAWCLSNQIKCKEIGMNGRCWIRQFIDNTREKLIMLDVLKTATAIQQQLGICANV
jgi:hypothetical protein